MKTDFNYKILTIKYKHLSDCWTAFLKALTGKVIEEITNSLEEP